MIFFVTLSILLASHYVTKPKIKEVCMNGKHIRLGGIFAVALIMLLALSVASASGAGSQGGGSQGAGSQGGGSQGAGSQGGGSQGAGSQGAGGQIQSGGSAQSGSGSDGQAGSLGDTLQTRDRDQLRDQTQDPDQDKTRDRTRDQLRTEDRELDPDLVYRDSDGEEHEWQERFNRRLQKQEDNDDPEGLTRSLNQIANRYRLSSEEDAEGFVKWALQFRPWAIGE
jgi:hypothetical protein